MITVSDLDKLEEQIRTNTAPALGEVIDRIKPQHLPRSLVARYANLLRRMGGTKHALKILNPIIRNGSAKPMVSEVVEYASCLNRLSLEDESIALLNEIKDEQNPEIQYELAVAHIFKWDYGASIPHFKKYLSSPELTPYKVCVGEMNLCAAYIYTDQIQEAESLLKNLIMKIQNGGFNLLWGNALELSGIIALKKADFGSAKNFFNAAREKLASSHPRYQLYIDKWLVITQTLKEGISQDSLAEFGRLRKKAADLKDWPTLREIELFKAVATNNIESITNLYHGVPYPGYRKRILQIWGKPLKTEKFHERRIGTGAGPTDSRKIFDVALGKDLFTGQQLKSGQVLHRLIQVLATDFYAPFLTTKIFSLVFSGTQFNPDTSPSQVYEVVKRLNRWFTKNKIPLTAHRGSGGYRLRANESYILRISTRFSLRSKLDNFLDNLAEFGLVEHFSAKMVEEKLNLSRRTITRLLAEGIASGKLIRHAKAQNTTYSFNKIKASA